MKVIPLDIYDKEGNLIAIEFNKEDGEFVVEAKWDENDEQTPQNRVAFRKWANHFVQTNLGYEVKL